MTNWSELSHKERKRLSKTARRILERLKEGPVSNTELSEMALRYGDRLTDLRAAGYIIENFAYDDEKGVGWYRLLEGRLPLWAVPCRITVAGELPIEKVLYVRGNDARHARNLVRSLAALVYIEEGAEQQVENGELREIAPVMEAA